MSQQNAPQAGARTAWADWGAAYKTALGVAATGVLMVACSPFLGGVLYVLAVTPLVELLGAPEGRDLLPASMPGAGADLLALFGLYNVLTGIGIFCARLVLELLGRGGGPVFTRRMGLQGKVALGTAAGGVAVLTAAGPLLLLVSMMFEDREHTVSGMLAALGVVMEAGFLLLACSLVTLLVGVLRRFLAGGRP